MHKLVVILVSAGAPNACNGRFCRIAVPRIVRVPTPAELTQTTGGTAAQQTQDAPDSAAPTSRAAAGAAVPAAAAPAAMPPLQAPRQREAPWSGLPPLGPQRH